MRRLWIAGALAALALPQPARAQFVGPPGGVFVGGGGVGLRHHGKRLDVAAFFGRSTFYQYGPFGPPLLGGYYGFSSFTPWPAPFAPPFFGPPPFPPPPRRPAVAAVVPLVIPARRETPADDPALLDPDRFIIVRPDKPNAGGGKPAEPLIPPARVEKKPKEVNLGVKPAEFPLAPPQGNARTETDRQLEQGQLAFARGEFGVALDRFRRAVALAPDESASWFLLAQTQFAVGKYDEAAASMAEGMKRRPDWPASAFRSRDVYRLNPAAFDVHLLNLRDAVTANPEDPRLLFVLGVELWFDDKRAEALPLFEKAARLAKDPAPALAFLKGK